jgi:hypothetical protein
MQRSQDLLFVLEVTDWNNPIAILSGFQTALSAWLAS